MVVEVGAHVGSHTVSLARLGYAVKPVFKHDYVALPEGEQEGGRP